MLNGCGNTPIVVILHVLFKVMWYKKIIASNFKCTNEMKLNSDFLCFILKFFGHSNHPNETFDLECVLCHLKLIPIWCILHSRVVEEAC